MRTLPRILFAVLTLVFAAAALPWAVKTYWGLRSSNPVRRGIARAHELGCFACHGSLGRGGLPDPGIVGQQVPGWVGGAWMKFVQTDSQVHEYILNGTERRESLRPTGRVAMPAYSDRLSGTDLLDLTAAFKVISGMAAPPEGTPARSGYNLSRKWGCENCHNVGGAGGLPNPGSIAGYVPGWYGSDFRDLVRSRDEFDTWLSKGSLPRIRDHWLGKRIVRRQRLSMPLYPQFTETQRDQLWSYMEWLTETDGGHSGVDPIFK